MTSPPDEVKAWLAKAGADLLSARILARHGRFVVGPAAFHCQQAAEKVLPGELHALLPGEPT
ncbi:MAG: HEPN domain-containing protein [Chloroflexi bacterium]|nr:HEPN domain-containing protein [Chloroflexota bacterium]